MNGSRFGPGARRFPLAVALAMAILTAVTPVSARGAGAFLGVTSEGLSGADAREAHLSCRDGALLRNVYSGTAAELAGLKAGDVLVTFGDEKIFDDRDLTELIQRREPGDKVRITLVRDGEKITVDTVLGTRDDLGKESDDDDHWSRFWDGIGDLFGGPSSQVDGPHLGVSVESIGEQMAEYFQVKKDEGVLLTRISRHSAAEDAGLLAGDVVIQVDANSIREPGDISHALRDRWGETVPVTVVRKGNRQEFQVALEEK